MRKLKILVAVAGAAALIAVSVGVGAALQQQRFKDVPTDHYAYDSVDWAVDIGVTAGCDGTNFCPEDNLNRAHMVTFLKRYHDWLVGDRAVSGAVPPKYATYEAAVTAADAWYEQMAATIGNGTRLADWKQVIPKAADKAAQWAGNDPIADRIAIEALLNSRTGDPTISERLGDIDEARFYVAAISYSLARGASAAAHGDDASESDAAAAAAWSAAGARLARLAHGDDNSRDEFYCSGCVLGGYDAHGYYGGEFRWWKDAQSWAVSARDAYFALAS